MKEKLIKFIKDNELNFNTSGSGLNSACVIISGYALHLGAINTSEIVGAILQLFPEADFEDELNRVFDYASDNNYEKFWSLPKAKEMYKF
jgi:hypothetical protein